MRTIPSILGFLVAASFGLRAEQPGVAAAASQFVRIDEDAKAARLQTAVTRYERDGVAVDLVGAVHIADRAYYQELNRRFGDYEVVLFELIGGERLKGGRFPERPRDEKSDSEAGVLGDLYGMFSTAMKLAGQQDVIDYGRDNFVHADLTLAEFEKLQAQRGESLMEFAVASAVEGDRADPAAGIDPGAVMSAILSGNANGLKLAVMKSMGRQDDQIAMLAGESVIISDRNAKCMRVLDAQLDGGRKRLAIFYGAAHFPDMEARLLKRGFRKTGESWLTAWDVPKPEAE